MADPKLLATQLSRMEEARRQTRHQLDMIDRRIRRTLVSLIPQMEKSPSGHPRFRRLPAGHFLDRYRRNREGLTAARQPEIDALSRKLARQEAAIAALRARLETHNDAEERSAA